MTSDLFLEMVRESGLVESRRLTEATRAAPPETQQSTANLAHWFIEQRLLTRYQAKCIYKGHPDGLLVDERFEIQDLLGKGGMGSVFLAWDRRRQHHVALKTLGRSRVRKRDLLRFEREIELSQRLRHPGIAAAYEAGQFNGRWFFVMEYVAGPTLFQQIKRQGTATPFWAARWLIDVADALAYAHQLGVIHRDLKPSNVIIQPNQRAKLLDLGLARWMADDHNESAVLGRKIVGSFDYMAPEQAEDSAQADARSDIYGVGCLLIFALVGKPPFHHVSEHKAKMQHHRTAAPPSLTQLRPDLPEGFADVVECMMAKNPADRFPSAGSVVDALRHLIGLMPASEIDTAVDTPILRLADEVPKLRPADDDDEPADAPMVVAIDDEDDASSSWWGRMKTGLKGLLRRDPPPTPDEDE